MASGCANLNEKDLHGNANASDKCLRMQSMLVREVDGEVCGTVMYAARANTRRQSERMRGVHDRAPSTSNRRRFWTAADRCRQDNTARHENGTERRQSGSRHHTRSVPELRPVRRNTDADGLAFGLTGWDGTGYA